LSTAAFPTAVNGHFFFAQFAAVLRAFSSYTRSRCVGAAVSAKRLDIAYPSGTPSELAAPRLAAIGAAEEDKS
jgi:hypothetical protein